MHEGGDVSGEKNKVEADSKIGKFSWARIPKWKPHGLQVHILTTVKGKALESRPKSQNGT